MLRRSRTGKPSGGSKTASWRSEAAPMPAQQRPRFRIVQRLSASSGAVPAATRESSRRPHQTAEQPAAHQPAPQLGTDQCRRCGTAGPRSDPAARSAVPPGARTNVSCVTSSASARCARHGSRTPARGRPALDHDAENRCVATQSRSSMNRHRILRPYRTSCGRRLLVDPRLGAPRCAVSAPDLRLHPSAFAACAHTGSRLQRALDEYEIEYSRECETAARTVRM